MEISVDLTLLLTICISILILFLSLRSVWKRRNLPPGPTPLPILGNILQITRGGMVKSLMKLSEKYGDVYTVYMGSRPVVVVTGYKTVKEILVDRGDDFLARGEMPMFDVYYKNHGIAFTSNMDRWRELRRFSLATLRDFGMGKRSIEDRIVEEALCLVAELKKTKDSVLNPRQYLNLAACNIIFSIMFGNRCEYETEELNTILSCINEAFVIVSSSWGQIFEMFPSIMRILPGRHKKMFWCVEKLLQFVNSRIKMNKETLDPNNPRDYIDSFLIKMEKEKNNPNTEYTMTNLSFSTLQIFFAGVDTISTTLTYSLLILIKHSDVLAKVHDEIDRVIGRNRHPKFQDRNQMPYADAVIHEIQRYVDLIPMGVPRKTPHDVQFRGYTIPKDTNVFPMLTSVLRDPSCFPYPDEFNPKNFLDESGELKKNNGFMPLSAGKRLCLGEALVRMELFLLLVTILQNFDLKSPVPLEDLDLTPEVSGLANFPKPYNLFFVSRDLSRQIKGQNRDIKRNSRREKIPEQRRGPVWWCPWPLGGHFFWQLEIFRDESVSPGSSTCGLVNWTMEISMDLTLLLTLCISSLVLFLSLKTVWKRRNLPPGPTALPILGNILQITRGGMVKSLLKLSEKYGDVYTVYMGSRPVVVVTGYKTVKEILVDRGDDFLARGEMPMFDVYYKNHGIAFTSNMDRWRELRRFSLTTLRDFGMGKRSIEDRIVEEALCLVAELKKTKDAILNPRRYLNQATCNIIFSIMFGNRCEYETEELNIILSCINEAFVIVSSSWGQIFDMFPRIMRILPGPHRRMFWCMEKLLQFIDDRIELNRKTLDPNNPRDYIDSFLIKMEKDKNNPNTEYTVTNLSFSTLQIFFAGVDTISTTLTYSLLILMKHSDVLAKVHDEIDTVIGRNRHPKLQDRNQMPYTDAVIHEIQRYVDLIPMGIPRKTPYDVQFRGYTIPKDTNVFPMLTSVLRDPSCFPYPDEFNPKNFLDDNGVLKNNNGFMPLSAGKRLCLGEALVRMELFLLFVTILQNFDLKSPVPLEDLDLAPEVSGLGNFPKPYKMSFVSRV
ncbi:uncharacterized protein O3C94_015727 [Discoglossus pictus]